ncbi:dTDP-4-dehydrorhamnose reductase [Paraburkholderia xenovorans]|uniref:dTDP-4-dehydrorhamnose reductase n=1 Tax=Paraburkholderia xenovorans TaxID=36873 RepID=UPI0038BC107A
MPDFEARTGRETAPILIVGAKGQLGVELCRSLAQLGPIVAMGRETCDLTSPEQIKDAVRSVRPRLVVNASGFTAVDAAETSADLAHAVNARAPGVLAAEAKALGALMIHYSTDYVFDGTKSAPYVEDDATAPLSVYGRSKLDGEHAVRGVDVDHWIFRTSWVFGVQGGNFLKSIARAARSRPSLSVVADQIGAPTPASLLADVTALAAYRYLDNRAPMARGVYHLAASGETSWHEFARRIVDTLAAADVALTVTSDQVLPVTAANYGSAAPRPTNSLLDTSKLRAALNIELPDWREGVDRVLAEFVAGQRLLG